MRASKVRWAGGTVGLLVATLSVAGCSHTVYHRVRAGETLYRISKAYGVSVDDIVAANRIADPARIEVGQRVRIPGARRAVPVSVVTPNASARTTRPDPRLRSALNLAWPVVGGGTLSSGFGQRGDSFHDGIDISAPLGTPVIAAQDGEVVFSDELRGYGNVIIIRHRDGYATVYAHNRSNQVREGQRVRRGQVIGAVGDTGHTTGANLHFEVRQDNVARDPLPFLPATEQVTRPGPGGVGG
jgi:lipoprotein NlpD